MTSEDNIMMADFVSTLERRLRHAAVLTAPTESVGRPVTRWRGLPRRRLLVAAVAAVALAVGILVVSASDDHGTPKAYGKPLVLSIPPVDATKELQGGLSVITVLGPNAKLTSARPISAFGGTAYLVEGNKGWCLSAPDPAADHPDLERGVTCISNAVFLRYGISLRLGQHYIAAIPQGVKDPTIRTPDGTVTTLHPSNLGVVVAEGLQDGTVITLYAPDGQTRTDKIRL